MAGALTKARVPSGPSPSSPPVPAQVGQDLALNSSWFWNQVHLPQGSGSHPAAEGTAFPTHPCPSAPWTPRGQNQPQRITQIRAPSGTPPLRSGGPRRGRQGGWRVSMSGCSAPTPAVRGGPPSLPPTATTKPSGPKSPATQHMPPPLPHRQVCDQAVGRPASHANLAPEQPPENKVALVPLRPDETRRSHLPPGRDMAQGVLGSQADSAPSQAPSGLRSSSRGSPNTERSSSPTGPFGARASCQDPHTAQGGRPRGCRDPAPGRAWAARLQPQPQGLRCFPSARAEGLRSGRGFPGGQGRLNQPSRLAGGGGRFPIPPGGGSRADPRPGHPSRRPHEKPVPTGSSPHHLPGHPGNPSPAAVGARSASGWFPNILPGHLPPPHLQVPCKRHGSGPKGTFVWAWSAGPARKGMEPAALAALPHAAPPSLPDAPGRPSHRPLQSLGDALTHGQVGPSPHLQHRPHPSTSPPGPFPHLKLLERPDHPLNSPVSSAPNERLCPALLGHSWSLWNTLPSQDTPGPSPVSVPTCPGLECSCSSLAPDPAHFDQSFKIQSHGGSGWGTPPPADA